MTAAQMLAHLSACLSWGVERELLERNCAMGIKPPVQKVARERVLTDAEIRRLWAATESRSERRDSTPRSCACCCSPASAGVRLVACAARSST